MCSSKLLVLLDIKRLATYLPYAGELYFGALPSSFKMTTIQIRREVTYMVKNKRV